MSTLTRLTGADFDSMVDRGAFHDMGLMWLGAVQGGMA